MTDELVKCLSCRGTGEQPCFACDGDEFDDLDQCLECGGTGVEACEVCDGTGYTDELEGDDGD